MASASACLRGVPSASTTAASSPSWTKGSSVNFSARARLSSSIGEGARTEGLSAIGGFRLRDSRRGRPSDAARTAAEQRPSRPLWAATLKSLGRRGPLRRTSDGADDEENLTTPKRKLTPTEGQPPFVHVS